MAMAWVDKNGGSSAKVKFIELPFPQMEAALVAGKVDAISVQEPLPRSQRVSRKFAYWRIRGVMLCRNFSSLAGSLRKSGCKKIAVRRKPFVRAVNRGMDAIHSDKEGARAAMIKWAGLKPDMVGKMGLPLFDKTFRKKIFRRPSISH